MQTRQELAEALGISHSTLAYFAYGLPDEKKYVSFSIPKRSGGNRLIHAPITPLKKIQRSISLLLKEFYQSSNPVCNHGYGVNRNIITNAKFHLGRRYIFKCDIKDFYPSISGARIMKVLTQRPFLYSDEAAHAIAMLATYNGHLPQGSPCSPVLSNIIARRLDRKLMKFSKSTGGLYTRYADDITISYNSLSRMHLCCDSNNRISENLQMIFDEEGFEINNSKTRRLTKRNRQIVTGIVINEKLNVKRDYVYRLRNLIFIINKYGFNAAAKALEKNLGIPRNPEKYIEGSLNFMRSVKGGDDSVYLGLVANYTKYKKDYKAAVKIQALEKIPIKILAEGKTDYKHFHNAMTVLNPDKVSGLEIDLKPVEGINGWSDLDEHVKKVKNVNLANLHIAIFDSDEKTINNKYPGRYHKITDSLYVFRLPRPKHLNDEDLYCIEMLFPVDQLKRCNSAGRRLYMTQEFDRQSSTLVNNPNVFSPEIKWNALVVDGKVFDNSGGSVKSVGLSKNDFADFTTQEISNENPFSYLEFSEVFNIISDIVEDFIKSPQI